MNSNQNPNQKGLTSVFGEVIFSYTRSQAIEDGELVDVTQTAQEAGFRYPVAVTRALWADIETIPTKAPWQDVQGRLWDILWMARNAMLKAPASVSRIAYELILFREGSRKKLVTLVCDCGPGDNAEPVITIGYAEDF